MDEHLFRTAQRAFLSGEFTELVALMNTASRARVAERVEAINRLRG